MASFTLANGIPLCCLGRSQAFQLVWQGRPARLAGRPKRAMAQAPALMSTAGLVGAAPIFVQFAPWPALLGGLTLGVAAAGKFAITGRILGISGTVRGFIQRDFEAWRLVFVAGMVTAAVLSTHLLPTAFDTIPDTFLVNAVAGGLLVGLGASMGNGCTSGHGICGTARLSIRSLVYVLLFMVSGVATASLFNTADSLNLVAGPAATSTADLLPLAALPAAAATIMLLLGQVGGRLQHPRAVSLATEACAGAMFTLGLVASGMTRPSKVLAFLSPAHAAFDPSLIMVMAGAVLVALPVFQGVLSKRWLTKPITAEKFALPNNNSLDWRLAIGGILFGAGWGLSGMCPGPAIVNLAHPSAATLSYLAAMFAGMWLDQALVAPMMRPKQTKPAATS